jgi:hypothetical protein
LRAGADEDHPKTMGGQRKVTGGHWSAVGQTRSSDRNRARSVHPLIADLRRQHRHDRFVPEPEVGGPVKIIAKPFARSGRS